MLTLNAERYALECGVFGKMTTSCRRRCDELTVRINSVMLGVRDRVGFR